MKLRALLQPRYLARRSLQRLGPALRRARLGRALDLISPQPDPYAQWRLYNDLRPHDRAEMSAVIATLAVRPTFSLVMPVCDPPVAYLHEAVESVRAQMYPDWELCIADDASADPDVRAYLAGIAGDPFVKMTTLETRGGISAATNAALAQATGDYVAFVDHDDTLAPQALYRYAIVAAGEPDVDVMYSDEDKIRDNPADRFDPYFKPDWSPETLLSKNYIGHLLAARRTLVAEVGGLRPAFDGSQDYDLVLRLAERSERIVHVPDILYHWRAHGRSAAVEPNAKPYAIDAAVAALSDALERRAEPGRVELVDGRSGRYRVRFTRRRDERVTIIIPTRDKAAVLDRCLTSIFERSTYREFDVLVVDNASVEPATTALLDAWCRNQRGRVRVLHEPRPFNFSAINNAAVSAGDAPFIVLLNNDTEILTPDWIEALLEYAQRPAIGAVGPLLLYPDGRVQHAGVVLGIGGLAGHVFKRFPAAAAGYFDALKSVTNYSAVTAACLMVRRDAYEAAGGFDETLPIAWNDVDFCLRLRAAGYRNVFLPHVRLVHHESLSRGLDTTAQRQLQTALEVARLRSRWGLATTSDPYYNPWLTLIREDASLGP